MRYIFIVNLFRDINVDTIFYKLSQTIENLAHPKSRIALFYGVRYTAQVSGIATVSLDRSACGYQMVLSLG